MASRAWTSWRVRNLLVLARALVALSIGWAFLAQPQRGLSQAGSPDEYQVKLAFLYNFTKFVEWPDQALSSPQAPFTICVVGADPFGKELENELRTRNAADHPIAVSRLGSSGDVGRCQIAFIRAEERKRLAAIISRAKGHDVLTVGEASGFLESGGQVNLVFIGKSLHLAVNLAATQQTHLKLSSKLLSLATNLGPRQQSYRGE